MSDKRTRTAPGSAFENPAAQTTAPALDTGQATGSTVQSAPSGTSTQMNKLAPLGTQLGGVRFGR